MGSLHLCSCHRHMLLPYVGKHSFTPYEKVNDVMETLVFKPITQNNSIFRSQIIAKYVGDGMLPCGVKSRTGRHGSVGGCMEGTLEDVPNNLKTQT